MVLKTANAYIRVTTAKKFIGAVIILLAIIAYLSTFSEKGVIQPSYIKEDLLGSSPFKEIPNSNKTYVVSAYFESDGKRVRIYLLRNKTFLPKVYCSFSKEKLWQHTDNCHGATDKLMGWETLHAKFVGFAVCFKLPESLKTKRPTSVSVTIERPKNDYAHATAEIYEGPPKNHKTFKFPHQFGVCVPPMYEMSWISESYLVHFFEVLRIFGANVVTIYLAEPPTEMVRKVLHSYVNHPMGVDTSYDFQIKVINWYLPIPGSTVRYRTQILAANDCLSRNGRLVKYIFFTDLDEFIVPHEQVGTNWTDLVRGLEKSGWKDNSATACFSAILFLMKITPQWNISIFYADKTIPQTMWKPWRKCLGKSGMLQWMWVHWPIVPSEFHDGNSVGTVYHYRRCDLFRGSYCIKPANISTNRVAWVHRVLAERSIAYRLSILHN